MDKAAHSGAGVLHLYGRYGGDIMNFGMAKDLCEMDDIEVREVLVTDDVASAPKGSEDKRRGVAGLVFAYKIAGAAAERMLPLDEVTRIAQKTVDNTHTMGVALTPCIVPEAGKATFSIGDDEMEIGMGIHGEPGIERTKLQTIDATVETMLARILDDLPFASGDTVAVLVNGLGATSLEELYILSGDATDYLKSLGIKVYRTIVGEYATSMEMMGASISICKLDNELKGYIDYPVNTPFIVQK